MKRLWQVVFLAADSRFPRAFIVEMDDKQAVRVERALQRAYESCYVGPIEPNNTWTLKTFLAESELKI
jgi:hypothetical protein